MWAPRSGPPRGSGRIPRSPQSEVDRHCPSFLLCILSLTSTDLTSPAPSLDLTLSAPCPDKASTITLLPESISSAPCPDKASTITLLSESILSAPYPDKASTITLLPESILSLQVSAVRPDTSPGPGEAPCGVLWWGRQEGGLL